MAERLVLCGETGRRRGSAVRLSLHELGRNMVLKVEDVARRMAAHLPSILTDLLEVAAYVYGADQAVSRGGTADRAGGKAWRRQFQFVVPVRNPARWSVPGVASALVEALSFMSEDTYAFEFVSLSKPPGFQSYFDLNGNDGRKGPTDEVVLFSGGMDSLGGAIARLEAGNRVVLVSHRAATKLLDHQRRLARELSQRYPGRVLHVPVQVNRHGTRAAEYTQRTRAFLFASLAAVIGHMMGCKRFLFCDNGVVSLNLPLAEQVVGARASRTTHPQALHRLQGFLSLLLGSPVEIDNPLFWRTRAEVAAGIVAAGHGDLLRHTVSCSHVHEMTKEHTHCGTCFQCLDRRFATLAAGAGDHDPAEMYAVDLLTGERRRGDEFAMAELYLRHHRDLLEMSDLRFQSHFALQVSRAARSLPDTTPDEVARGIADMHRRQAVAVRTVLSAGVKQHAEELLAHCLPPSSLLRLAVGANDVMPPDNVIRDLAERAGPMPALTFDKGRDCPELPEIRVAVGSTPMQARIQGVKDRIMGAGAALLGRLAETFREDQTAGRAPERFRFLRGKVLASRLNVDEASLRRRVLRLRQTIRRSIEASCQLSIQQTAVIDSNKWDGYRLNPHVRLVAMGEWPAEVTPDPLKSHDS